MKKKSIFSIILAGALAITMSSCYGLGDATMNEMGGYGYMATYADYYYDGEEDWRYVEMNPAENYNTVTESPFINAATSPLSTFSANPNTAAYSNMRRIINSGNVPPAQSVRIEEYVNYFNYDYPTPQQGSPEPFSINAEVAVCPWNPDNLLAMVGIQGERLQSEQRVPNNVVFLIDVSGSMSSANRLPLVKESFLMLLDQLDENDRISIVTYAGSNKVLADSVKGSDRKSLEHIIKGLSAGGSTGGSAGITEAYALAHKNFIEGGNNRIILATDGDFNVGLSSVADIIPLVQEQKEKGVFITVLGYGMGNLNDHMLEEIAKQGSGNYAYIDTIEEAQKFLVDQFDSTMYVIAKDLKLQVEFNPAVVKEYRLIGYDNRRLNNEDFNDDKKDGGDIGAGFTVTAFYELVLHDGESNSSVDELIYQTAEFTGSSDYMNIKVRYKAPSGGESSLVQKTITEEFFTQNPSDNFKWASAVAEFGLILRNSDYKGNADINSVIERAENCRGDNYGLRSQFIELAKKYKQIIN